MKKSWVLNALVIEGVTDCVNEERILSCIPTPERSISLATGLYDTVILPGRQFNCFTYDELIFIEDLPHDLPRL